MTLVNLIFTYSGHTERYIEDAETIVIAFHKDQYCKCKYYEECDECKCKCGYFSNSEDEESDCICLRDMFYEGILHPFRNEEFVTKMIYLLGKNIHYNGDEHFYYNPDRDDNFRVYDVTPDDKGKIRLDTINFLTQMNTQNMARRVRRVRIFKYTSTS